MKALVLFILVVFSHKALAENKVVEIDPSEIQMNGYAHESLPRNLLVRIKATTDTFEIVDGLSYEKAVDLYKRDINPESNLVIWEEMARVYNKFCDSRCNTPAERMDVYRALLLRSMFPDEGAFSRLNPKVITASEAKDIISQYNLEAKPIDVIQK